MKCHSNFILFETHFFFKCTFYRGKKERESNTGNVFALKSPVVFHFRVLVWLLSFVLLIRGSLPQDWQVRH